MIGLNNLHKTYITGSNKLHVLKGIDVQIEAGEIMSVMGSSGSGKSTLLNIIGLLIIMMTENTIWVENKSRK